MKQEWNLPGLQLLGGQKNCGPLPLRPVESGQKGSSEEFYNMDPESPICTACLEE